MSSCNDGLISFSNHPLLVLERKGTVHSLTGTFNEIRVVVRSYQHQEGGRVKYKIHNNVDRKILQVLHLFSVR
jgi:hypothetical protein